MHIKTIKYHNMLFNDKKAKIANSDQNHNFYKEYRTKSGANTDSWKYQSRDGVPQRSKPILLTGYTRREPYS